MKYLFLIFMALALTVTVPLAAPAATVEGVSFEKEFVGDDQSLPLRGAGLFRYLYFIKAYVGALYLPEGVTSDRVLEDVPKRLEISYFHPIEGDDFGPATVTGMRRNIDDETFKRIETKVELHNSLYKDVSPGDRYALTYIPGRGTRLELNGQTLGVIPGAEFASALFSIWLGEAPINTDFKKSILGEG